MYNERMNQNILVTGGTGYIATHTIVSLLNAGYDVTIVDNLINSSEASLEGVRAICGCSSDRIRFFKVVIQPARMSARCCRRLEGKCD